MLARSLITGDLPDRALLARVEGQDAKDLIGAKDNRNYSGIEFPYVFPGELGVRASRIRRDSPEIEVEFTADGQEMRKEVRKYVGAIGSRNILYFFPETPIELVTDVRTRVLFLEGEKKCLCAWYVTITPPNRASCQSGSRASGVGAPKLAPQRSQVAAAVA